MIPYLSPTQIDGYRFSPTAQEMEQAQFLCTVFGTDRYFKQILQIVVWIDLHPQGHVLKRLPLASLVSETLAAFGIDCPYCDPRARTHVSMWHPQEEENLYG